MARRVGNVEEIQTLLSGAVGVAAGETSDAIGAGFAAAALVGAIVAALGIGPLLGLRKSLTHERVARRAERHRSANLTE